MANRKRRTIKDRAISYAIRQLNKPESGGVGDEFAQAWLDGYRAAQADQHSADKKRRHQAIVKRSAEKQRR